MSETHLFSTEHIELVGMILIPLGIGIARLIWVLSQLMLKVDIIWEMLGNHMGMGDEMDAAMLRRRNGGKRQS